MRGISVLVAGAGLAGLTAARELTTKGARGHRHRRARSRRRPRPHRARAVSPRRACRSRRRSDRRKPDGNLQADRGRRTAHGEDPAWRLHVGPARSAAGAALAASTAWQDLAKRLQPEVRAFRLSEQRWDGGVADSLARESVAQWLDRIRAPQGAAGTSLSACAASSSQIPTSCRCWRSPISSPTKAPPAARRCSASSAATIAFLPLLAKALGSSLQLRTILRRVDTDARRRHGRARIERARRRGAVRLSRLRDAGDDVARCRVRAGSARDSAAGSDSSQVRRRDENRAAIRSRAVAQARQASSVRHPVSDRRRLGRKRGAARIAS